MEYVVWKLIRLTHELKSSSKNSTRMRIETFDPPKTTLQISIRMRIEFEKQFKPKTI